MQSESSKGLLWSARKLCMEQRVTRFIQAERGSLHRQSHLKFAAPNRQFFMLYKEVQLHFE